MIGERQLLDNVESRTLPPSVERGFQKMEFSIYESGDKVLWRANVNHWLKLFVF